MDNRDYFGELLDTNGLLNQQTWLIGIRRDPICFDDSVLAYFRVQQGQQTEVVCCFRVNKSRQELVFWEPRINLWDNSLFDMDLFETREGETVIKVEFGNFLQFLSAETGRVIDLKHIKRKDIKGRTVQSWHEVSLQDKTSGTATLAEVYSGTLLFYPCDEQEQPHAIPFAVLRCLTSSDSISKIDSFLKHQNLFDPRYSYDLLHCGVAYADQYELLLYCSQETKKLRALTQSHPRQMQLFEHLRLFHKLKTKQHLVCIFSKSSDANVVVGPLLVVWRDLQTGKNREFVVNDLQFEPRIVEVSINPTTLNVYFWLPTPIMHMFVVRFHDANVRYDECCYQSVLRNELAVALPKSLIAACWDYICPPLLLESVTPFPCLGFRREQPIDFSGKEDFTDSDRYLKLLFL